ncbi:hypothetical protein KDW03_03115 [Thermospira aquatica]|uniref:Uncharacterized protein n=1 Tax=Thermospira aquatica TaxID=2828656 RepID=A0AAX3BF86_9SPIR|nr:hypothetical protein [Thermospira aquatica]URA10810.1 hypothetical protein KDW03_03115 [Thermospira aquatica]
MFERRPIYRKRQNNIKSQQKGEKEILDYFVRITGLKIEKNNIKKPAKRRKGDTGLLCEDNRFKNRNYAARLLRTARKNHLCRQEKLP